MPFLSKRQRRELKRQRERASGATARHEEWLRTIRASPSRRRELKDVIVHQRPDLSVDQDVAPTSDRIVHTPRVRPVVDAMALASESEETRREILAKSKRIASTYNKGGYTYITPGTNMAHGKRRED